jgi:hypothetical protein
LSDTSNADGGISGSARFGSAHSEGFNIANCDGSVSFVSYEVDPRIHFQAGHRSDNASLLEHID